MEAAGPGGTDQDPGDSEERLFTRRAGVRGPRPMSPTIFRVTPPLEKARSSDVAELLRLRTEAEDWLASRAIDQWRRGQVTVRDFQRQVEAGEWHVERVSPGLRGALRLLWSDPEVWQHEDSYAGYVHGLVIDRAHAGRGAGAALLAWAEQETRIAGARSLRLDCAESNSELRAYYGRLGFREVGRRDVPDRPWLAATLLEKQV